jgi:hypothetical protein
MGNKSSRSNGKIMNRNYFYIQLFFLQAGMLDRSGPTSPRSINSQLGSFDGRRARSLVRPERARQSSRSRTRDIFRENDFAGVEPDGRIKEPWYAWWPITYSLLTCCFPSWVLSTCGRMKDKRVQKAWREKVALCIIILVMCLSLGFLTF